MADINTITQGAQYQGNAALGGKLAVGVTLDPSPLARLATFTYYRDRDFWEKKNQDDKVAADKIAQMVAYDTTSPLKPFSDDLKKELKSYQDYVRDNPDSLVYSRNPEKFQRRIEMENILSNKRKNATINDTLYNAKKAKIESIPNKADRDAQLELLKMDANDLFKSGVENAYEQQLQLSPELKPEDYKIPEIPLTEAFTITRNANDTVIEGKAYADMDRVDALADAAYFGLGQAGIDTESPQFKNLSEDEKKRVLLENSVTARKRVTLENIAASIDGMVQSTKAKFSDPNNPIQSITDIPDNALTQQGSIGNYIRSVKGYNKQIDEINAATGKNYPHINLDDGATPQEIIKLDFFNKNGETLYKELKPTVQQTDNELQRAKMAQDAALAREGLQWDKDKFKIQTAGSEENQNAAMIFADNLFADLAANATFKGDEGTFVLGPDAIRKLTAEQLKFLGQELPPERDPTSGVIIKSGGLSPLSLGENEVLQVNPDGTLLVMKDARLITKNGKRQYVGTWDNTRSTSVTNVARGVLNDENAKSGTKERKAYTPIDTKNRKAIIHVDKIGGGTTVSGSTSTGGVKSKGTYTVTDPTTGKVIGTDWTDGEATNAQKKGFKIELNK